MGCEENKIAKKEETCQDNKPETPKTDANKASVKNHSVKQSGMFEAAPL